MRKVMVLTIFLLVVAFVAFAMAQEPKKANVDLNKATAEELAKVPGLNKNLAEAIVKYRDDAGDIQALTELLKIKGIDRNLLKQIQPYINLDSVGGDCTC